MNQVKLIGNLGKDAETKTFSSGAKKTNFSLATTERYTNKRGETVTDTQWHTIFYWGQSFDAIEPELKKGANLTIIGKLLYNRYTDKEGKTRYITEILAQEILITAKTQPVAAAPVSANTNSDYLPF